MGNPQAAAHLATIKLQLGKRASAGDAQAAALLQKIQGFEIQAAVAAQTQNMQAPSAAPGMPPGYESPGLCRQDKASRMGCPLGQAPRMGCPLACRLDTAPHQMLLPATRPLAIHHPAIPKNDH